jgi:hypothetical protein
MEMAPAARRQPWHILVVVAPHGSTLHVGGPAWTSSLRPIGGGDGAALRADSLSADIVVPHMRCGNGATLHADSLGTDVVDVPHG